MRSGSINLLAVTLSAAVAYGLNFVWFNILFRAAYVEGLGRSQAVLDQGPSLLVASILQFIGYVVAALALGWLMRRADARSLAGGVRLALIVWIGIVVGLLGPRYAFEAYSLTFFLVSAGGPLVALLVMGTIQGTWR